MDAYDIFKKLSKGAKFSRPKNGKLPKTNKNGLESHQPLVNIKDEPCDPDFISLDVSLEVEDIVKDGPEINAETELKNESKMEPSHITLLSTLGTENRGTKRKNVDPVVKEKKIKIEEVNF